MATLFSQLQRNIFIFENFWKNQQLCPGCPDVRIGMWRAHDGEIRILYVSSLPSVMFQDHFLLGEGGRSTFFSFHSLFLRQIEREIKRFFRPPPYSFFISIGIIFNPQESYLLRNLVLWNGILTEQGLTPRAGHGACVGQTGHGVIRATGVVRIVSSVGRIIGVIGTCRNRCNRGRITGGASCIQG